MSISSQDPSSPRQFIDVRKFTTQIVRHRSWFVSFIVLDILVVMAITSDPILIETWNYIVPGIAVTIQIAIVSFILATIVGLVTALGRISSNSLIYNSSTLYVELFRGLPLLVIILIFSFVITPALIDFVTTIPFLDDLLQHLVGIPEDRIATTLLRTRDIEETTRIIFAFALTYGAFMSEVFRAGIESIGRGQMEAARSLGMTYTQAMRYVILPQAVRNVLPAMANNFVLLLKDTSLASVVAVPEISHLTRQYSSNRFRYPQGLLILSFIYANLTIIMSMGVYWLESRLKTDKRED
ncbi:MAG: amino acid ABC transporter permease [Anaerolineae bacterium]|nr:amino acid ABC transporter permease [Anaerolineae bacterium]NUQ02513.1 amino acid ABC transporter permease [Anaerolineae bacterium]